MRKIKRTQATPRLNTSLEARNRTASAHTSSTINPDNVLDLLNNYQRTRQLLNQSRTLNSSLQKQVKTLKTENGRLSKANSVLEKQITDKQQQIENLRQQFRRSQAESKQKNKSIAQLSSILSSKQAETRKLQQKLKNAETTIWIKNVRMNQLYEEIDQSYRQEIHKLKFTNRNLLDRLARCRQPCQQELFELSDDQK